MDSSLTGYDYDDLEGVENVITEADSWTPIPVELDNETLATHASFDIIATLVDIYGDTDFVNEYKYDLNPSHETYTGSEVSVSQPETWIMGD